MVFCCSFGVVYSLACCDSADLFAHGMWPWKAKRLAKVVTEQNVHESDVKRLSSRQRRQRGRMRGLQATWAMMKLTKTQVYKTIFTPFWSFWYDVWQGLATRLLEKSTLLSILTTMWYIIQKSNPKLGSSQPHGCKQSTGKCQQRKPGFFVAAQGKPFLAHPHTCRSSNTKGTMWQREVSWFVLLEIPWVTNTPISLRSTLLTLHVLCILSCMHYSKTAHGVHFGQNLCL